MRTRSLNAQDGGVIDIGSSDDERAVLFQCDVVLAGESAW